MNSEPLIAKSAATLAAFPPSGSYLIGVSGGRDSVALLHLLTSLGYKNLLVCHLDHGLRGRDSLEDAKFSVSLAARYCLDCAVDRLAKGALSATGESMETAARQARHTFFAQVARRNHRAGIFLGHHADDQVETVLWNFLRGAGLDGLGGMRPVTMHAPTGLTFIRPLLGIWRNEIDRYVDEHSLDFRDDATNHGTGPSRNTVRLELIPHLQKTLGRNIRKSIWKMGELAAADTDWLEMLTPAPREKLSVRELRDLPLAAQRRLIRQWLKLHTVREIDFEMIESVRSLASDLDQTPARTNLTESRQARRTAGQIWVTSPVKIKV